MTKPIGYLVEPEVLERLRTIANRLHGGTDRERDDGHRIWLIVNQIEQLPVNE